MKFWNEVNKSLQTLGSAATMETDAVGVAIAGVGEMAGEGNASRYSGWPVGLLDIAEGSDSGLAKGV